METETISAQSLKANTSLAGAWTESLENSAHQSTILIVDDLDINLRLLGVMLRQENYHVLEARRAVEALELLELEKVDLVILDTMMPEMDGMECCRRMKANRRTELIPVLMLTCVQNVETQIAGIGSGADEFLGKPFHPEVLRTRIRSLLRHKSAIDRLEETETILFALACAVEKRDQCTGGHCERLAGLSMALGSAMGLSHNHLLALQRGGYLHDIGKVSTPDAILFKPGSLDEQEWVIMKTHASKGEEICRPLKSLEEVLPIIRHHHERWDGTGYPDGLRGSEIPLLARVLQLADIYDALTTIRPYKSAFKPDEALRMMQEEAERGWRDPEMMALFTELHRKALERARDHDFEARPDASELENSLQDMARHLVQKVR